MSNHFCGRSDALRLKSFVLLACMAMGAGCATTRPSGPDYGDVDVANLENAELEVRLEGRVEATIPAGARTVVRFVPAGRRTFRMRAGDGPARDVVLDVPRGGVVGWHHVPENGDALPIPAPFAVLLVSNTLKSPVLVRVEGVTLGRLVPGDRRAFHGLTAGAVLAEAVPDDGTETIVGRLELVPGEVASWEVQAAGRAVEVRNTTDEAVFVLVDGETRGRVAPGASATFVESLRLHAWTAVSEPSRRRYERDLDLRGGTEPLVWELARGNATMRVVNRTAEPVEVRSGERTWPAIAPNGELELEALDTGLVTFEARESSGRVHMIRRSIDAGDRLRWVVSEPAGSVRIENTTQRALEIFVGPTGGPSFPVGRVESENASEVNRLAPGTWVLEAYDIIGGQRFVTTVELAEQRTTTWQIRSEASALRILNRRREAVAISVDGGQVGTVASGESLVVTGIAPGLHLVDAAGVVSGSTRQEKVAVALDTPTDIVLTDRVGTVQVVNATGEAVVPVGPLAGQGGRIADGDSATFVVPAGANVMAFGGEQSALTFEAAIVVDAGGSAEVTLSRARSALIITNQLGEVVAVSMGTRVIGMVEHGAAARFDGLEPGRADLQVVGISSGRFRSVRVNLAPGADRAIRLEPSPAAFVVENRSPEPVDIFIDNRLFGTVSPGAARGFGRLAAGEHALALWFGTSRRELSQTAVLAEGEKRLIVAELPAGTVLVENTSREPVIVSVDGAIAAELGPEDAPRWIAVPPGSRHVDVDYRNSNFRESLQLEVRVDSATHLPIRARQARLVIVNQHDAALELTANDRALGSIDAMASRMLEDLQAGTLRVEARDAEGRVTHVGTVRLWPGQTATWVLTPPPLP